MIYCNVTDCIHNISNKYGTICNLKNIYIEFLSCTKYKTENNKNTDTIQKDIENHSGG